MRPEWRWPTANAVALLLVVAVNGLANALPLNDQTTGDVINKDPVYFQPAGWVFAIWGLIYLWLGAFVLYGFLPAGRANPRLLRISPFFLVTCAANATWLFLWHWEQFELSTVAMAVLLLALIGIYLVLRAGTARPAVSEWLCLWLPFSVYLGWVSVAAIANVAVTLDRRGWNGWGIADQAWAAIMILVGGGLAAALGLRRADFAYAAVFVWAFAGIAVRQRDHWFVAAVAGIVALAAAAITVVAVSRHWQTRTPPRPALVERQVSA